MPARQPLQVMIICRNGGDEAFGMRSAILAALRGEPIGGSYVPSAESLDIQVAVFTDVPHIDVVRAFGSFAHTLAVVLVDEHLTADKNPETWAWLSEAWTFVKGSQEAHGLFPVALDERAARDFGLKLPELSDLQLLAAGDLGERAIRPALLALRILHECRLLLAGGIAARTADTGKLRIFISHAKLDGLPLAQALKYQIEALRWLESFYDAKDLPAGKSWPQELEKGVRTSLIVMLRTEAYDGRYWCQQEVHWADEYAVPAVLVDARTALTHKAGLLPFDRIPTVRIPDGNLLRILFFALREDLRFLNFSRLVQEMQNAGELPPNAELRVFSYAPSMAALLKACQLLAKSTAGKDAPRIILYPDPPYRAGNYEAAQAMVKSVLPDARLATPQTLAALAAPQPPAATGAP